MWYVSFRTLYLFALNSFIYCTCSFLYLYLFICWIACWTGFVFWALITLRYMCWQIDWFIDFGGCVGGGGVQYWYAIRCLENVYILSASPLPPTPPHLPKFFSTSHSLGTSFAWTRFFVVVHCGEGRDVTVFLQCHEQDPLPFRRLHSICSDTCLQWLEARSEEFVQDLANMSC